MEPTELFQRLALALGIGLLVGVERGWRQREDAPGQRTAGLRTFTLIGLLGGIEGAIAATLPAGGGGLLLGLSFLTLGAVLGVFQFRESVHEGSFSVTSVISGLVTFALGSYALLGDRHLAAAGGVATAAILAAREPLHAFIARVTWPELRSAILLLGMSFIALPLVPDRTIGIGGFEGLNLRELWLVVIVLAAVAFGGYVAVKVLGARRGVLVAAAAGGLVSSTAVTLTNARRAASGEGEPWLLAGATLIAGTVSLLRTLVLLAVLSGAAMKAAPPLLAAAGAALVCGLVFARRSAGSGDGAPALSNPFALGPVLSYAAALAVVVVISRAASSWLGPGATLAVAGIAGLADLDAATFAMAKLAQDDGTAALAALGVVVAAGSNTLAKAVMGSVLGGRRFAGPLLAGSAVMFAAGGLAAVVIR
ncbi:MgtC/SapB family protein [Blastochloris viridis]|uniref:MgtC family protein n=1 Tax=Blastochloris viridis TaxID=1079 RepID=A0A0H5BFF5_BLAVI|nr:DUF4010 domain-containing protein [Blastochloris viridis]ALK09197.1 hypothetical protein BVIR_1412 [Blastochloris viridis]BAS00936.1 MgtC family protein [Blastochloris viridis]CUU41860.1 hypothetical protein BVIRIDIS_08570 [Blastochloris viridis]